MKSSTILILLASIATASSASRLPTRRVAPPTQNSADVPAQAPTPKTLNSARKVGPPTSLQQPEIPMASMNDPVPVSVRPKIMSPPISTEPLPVEPIVMLSVPRPKPREQASVRPITKQEFVPEEAQEVVSQPIDTAEENQLQPREIQTPSDAIEQVAAFEVSAPDEGAEGADIFEPEIVRESVADEQPPEITEETVADEQQPSESSPNPEATAFEESEEEAALVVEVIQEADSELEETLEQPPEDESKSLEVIETEEEIAENESQSIAVPEDVNVDSVETMISGKNNSPVNGQPAADGSDESDLDVSDEDEVNEAPVEDESQLSAVAAGDDMVEATIIEERAEESLPNEQPPANDSEATDLAISDGEEIVKEVLIESSIKEEISVKDVEDESKSLETVDRVREAVVQQTVPDEQTTPSTAYSEVASEPGTSPTCVMPEDGSPPSCDSAQAATAFESEGDSLSQAIDVSES